MFLLAALPAEILQIFHRLSAGRGNILRMCFDRPVLSSSNRMNGGFLHSLLDIIIEKKFIGMRADTHRINFLVSFIPNPGFDQIFRKDLSFQEKLIILL